MKKTLALVATAVALGLASPTFAAEKTGAQGGKANAEMCDSLLKQVDEAMTREKHRSPNADAEKKRDEGAKACSEGKHDEGVKALHAALKDLGVKPDTNGSKTRSGY